MYNRAFRTNSLVFTLFFVCLLTVTATAQNDEIKVPDEVKPFVEKGKVAIALETADLNADGRKDLILVASEPIAEDAAWEEGAGERSVLILVREPGGALKLA